MGRWCSLCLPCATLTRGHVTVQHYTMVFVVAEKKPRLDAARSFHDSLAAIDRWPTIDQPTQHDLFVCLTDNAPTKSNTAGAAGGGLFVRRAQHSMQTLVL
eukprot:m.426649 g.426649  ORF g.426649 m.426649 type:complete len:101 (-) comp20222_c11_seq7:851-1153(-)